MSRIPEMMGMMGFGAEIIYAFVIIICCLMIYLGTKELYKLSAHEGIKYFRISFLLFALAFFFRSFIKLAFLIVKDPRIFILPPDIFQSLTTILFIYFSTIAIFYLIYSMLWKKLRKFPRAIYLMHLLAFITALIIILSKNILVYFFINIALLLFIIITITIIHRNEKKNLLKVIYVLLSIFLFLNIIDILIPKFLEVFQLLIYLASISIFLWILHKVLTKAGSN